MIICSHKPQEATLKGFLCQNPQVPDFGGLRKRKCLTATTWQRYIELQHFANAQIISKLAVLATDLETDCTMRMLVTTMNLLHPTWCFWLQIAVSVQGLFNSAIVFFILNSICNTVRIYRRNFHALRSVEWSASAACRYRLLAGHEELLQWFWRMSDIAAGVFSYTAHARVLNQRNWDSGLFNIKQQKHDFFNQLLLRS